MFEKYRNANKLLSTLGKIPTYWSLTPLVEKRPYRTNWQNEATVSRHVMKQAILKGRDCISKKTGKPYRQYDTGFGLRTGEVSGYVLAIDFDGETAHQLLTCLDGYIPLPETISWTSGKKGRCQKLFQVTEAQREKLKDFNRLALSKVKGFECEQGEQLELRYNGCQSVLPPSYHPETGCYQWINNPHTPLADLPDFIYQYILSTVTTEVVMHTSNPYEAYLNEQIIPVDIEVPLEQMVAPSTRDLLMGVGQGSRDNSGAAIARDLIGTENYLRSIGQAFFGDSYDLLSQFCSQCSPALSRGDCDRIFKSAQKNNPSPCLDAEKIDNNIRAWYWNNSDVKQKYYTKKKKNSVKELNSNSGVATAEKKFEGNIAELKEAIAEARQILLTVDDEITQNLLLEQLRQKAGISDYTWDNKFLKPLRRQYKEERLKFDISLYLQEGDLVKATLKKQQICGAYSLSSVDFMALCEYMAEQERTPQKRAFSFSEFMNRPNMMESWLVPGILPKGELLLLTALPKVGKTLLANDLAYAVAEGGQFMGETATQGRVLYVGSDETDGSLMRRFQARGFDLVDDIDQRFRVMNTLSLGGLNHLEEELEDFRPDLVVIDSLTSITLDSKISEKDAEYARGIYKLKDLLKKYNSACVLIHHENKNKEAKGISKVSGSARITAAVWGIAQMVGGELGETGEGGESSLDSGKTRWLNLQPREGEKVRYTLEMNAKEFWAEEGIFKFIGESDDPNGTNKTQGEMVVNLLKKCGKRLEYGEIDRQLGLGKSLSTVLSRLVDRKMVNRSRSVNNPRRFVYFIDNCSQETVVNTNELITTTPPSPTYSQKLINKNSTTIMDKELEVSQQLSKQVQKPDQQVNNDLGGTNMGVVKEKPEPVVVSASGIQEPEKREGGVSNDSVDQEKTEENNCKMNSVIDKKNLAQYMGKTIKFEVNNTIVMGQIDDVMADGEFWVYFQLNGRKSATSVKPEGVIEVA